jgi:vesicle-fusing ATPase
VVSISACHADDQGSIPCGRIFRTFFLSKPDDFELFKLSKFPKNSTYEPATALDNLMSSTKNESSPLTRSPYFSMSVSLTADNLTVSSFALTNKVYLNPIDFSKVNASTPASNGSAMQQVFVQLKGEFIFIADSDDKMSQGSIGLNLLQRESMKISLGEVLIVKKSVDAYKIAPWLGLKLSIEPLTKSGPTVEIPDEKISNLVLTNLNSHVLRCGTIFAVDIEAKKYKLTVLSGNLVNGEQAIAGTVIPSTSISIVSGHQNVQVLSSSNATKQIFHADFNFESFGIGGLSEELSRIFRKVFASRMLPAKIARQWQVNHIRGLLLYGPPGTGKTLLARQIAKFVNSKEPKIVNGPEILDKYVGGSEQKIRELFADAEKDQKQLGEQSQLHIIILDELDAICKQRGSTRDGTGVHDSIVNQLLSKIDGVDSLNNILLIGMTNRLDMIDEALLRPGRFEEKVEISLADEKGRLEILHIHTRKMKENGRLANDVDLEYIARHTKNFSGAELEGLVRSAKSYAFDKIVNFASVAGIPGGNNTSSGKPVTDFDSVLLTQADFLRSLEECIPAFGADEEDLKENVRYGIIRFSSEVDNLIAESQRVVDFVVNAAPTTKTDLIKGHTKSVSDTTSLLFYGVDGSGRTALACNIATTAGFPFIRVISPDRFIGMSENAKINSIAKVFDDAYKSTLSCVILDDIERLIEFSSIGMRFSNPVVQAIMVLIKRPHPKPGRKLLVLGTCGQSFYESVMNDLGLEQIFDEVHKMPVVKDIKEAALVAASVVPQDAVVKLGPALAAMVNMDGGVPIKRLLKYVEMSRED